MRRPVKPFVTEYRGGTRRQTPGGHAAKPDFASIEAEMPAAELRPAAARSADLTEDSYEAALRAADALFSSRQAAPSSAQAETGSDPWASHPSGGRVLRVLDEPESPEMARLEAERAPKRRGRKPGSKNKPKPVAPLLAREALSSTLMAENDTPAAVLAMPIRLVTRPLAATRAPAVAALRAGDKYAWVRTKLKPGQQWKRRLPKVAW